MTDQEKIAEIERHFNQCLKNLQWLSDGDAHLVSLSVDWLLNKVKSLDIQLKRSNHQLQQYENYLNKKTKFDYDYLPYQENDDYH